MPTHTPTRGAAEWAEFERQTGDPHPGLGAAREAARGAARAAGYCPDQVDGVLRVFGREPGVDDRLPLVMCDGHQFVGGAKEAAAPVA